MIVEQDPENASLKIIRQTKAITIIGLVKQYLIKHSIYIHIVIINFFCHLLCRLTRNVVLIKYYGKIKWSDGWKWKWIQKTI